MHAIRYDTQRNLLTFPCSSSSVMLTEGVRSSLNSDVLDIARKIKLYVFMAFLTTM